MRDYEIILNQENSRKRAKSPNRLIWEETHEFLQSALPVTKESLHLQTHHQQEQVLIVVTHVILLFLESFLQVVFLGL